jgi:hypothetical protein
MPGGEVDILDPAGYGPATISHAVSVVNDGVGTAGVLQGNSSAAAIAINAGAGDAVILRGLNINGLGTGGVGVLFTSGSSLTIENCAIEAFNGDGVSILPTSSNVTFTISNTTVANNSGVGIKYDPTGTTTAKGSISRAIIDNNLSGIVINTQNSASAPTTVTIANSVLDGNHADGIDVANINSAPPAVETVVMVDASQIDSNSGAGIDAENSSVVLLRRSVVVRNQTGIQDNSTGDVNSYGDNSINWNGTDVAGVGGLNILADLLR